MKAYSKKLLLATLIIIPYTTQGMNEQSIPDNIQDAEQKVNVEAAKVDEIQASFAEATERMTAIQGVTDQILQASLDQPDARLVETLLNEHAATLLNSQARIIQILNRQLEQHYQTVKSVAKIHDYQQRIQTTYERQRDQAAAQPNNNAMQDTLALTTRQLNEIGVLVQQVQAHKNTIEQAILTTQPLASRAVAQTIETITRIKQTIQQFTHQPNIDQEERQAYTITIQIITSLLDIEQDIKALLQQELYIEAFQGATIAQNVQNVLWPVTPDNIPAMQTREQQIQAATERVKNLIPVEPTVDEPLVTTHGATPGQQQTRPQRPAPGAPSGPTTAPTAPPQRTPPPVGPSGKALENIKKANTTLVSALHRLDVVRGYLKQIDAAERTVVKKKVARIFKEYESGLSNFANRIRKVKAENGQLDQQKLVPFDKFVELTDKLSAKVKNL